MSDGFEHGPLRTYEVIWKSGHVETLQAHQVTHQGGMGSAFGMFDVALKSDREERVMFHGELDGCWLLVLSAPAAEIAVIRLVLQAEHVIEADAT